MLPETVDDPASENRWSLLASAARLYAAAPQTGGRGREEGSLLGGLGRILDGDKPF